MKAALFPGQGSQSVGMGKSFYDNFTLAKHMFEEASDALKQDLKKLCFDGPESDLTLTENTQPALLLVSSVIYKVVENETGFRPQFAAGHSLGEYSAFVAAESMDFVPAIKAVKQRGQAMQSACPIGQGAMAAVLGLDDSEIEKVCSWAERESGFSPLRPANFNSPGQIVISGSAKTLEWLKSNFDPEKSGVSKKLKMIPLNVSAPFHSPMMKPAQEKMAIVLNDMRLSVPRFAVVQNTTARETENVDVLRRELIAQVSAPVKWSQSVMRLKELGVTRAVEFGHGKVLAGLVKKTCPEIEVVNIQTVDDLKNVADLLKNE